MNLYKNIKEKKKNILLPKKKERKKKKEIHDDTIGFQFDCISRPVVFPIF